MELSTMAFNLRAFKNKKKPAAPKRPGISEPMLGIVNGYGEVRMEYERGRFHHTIFGPIETAKARARFRYDPADGTVMWTDRDDARDPEVFWAVVNAIESRGGDVERHSTLGRGVIRMTPDGVLAFNMRHFLGAPTIRIAVVSPSKAKQLPIKKELPDDPLFADAVKGTTGAEISEDGLLLPVVRQQHPDQSEMGSLRDGVFYQPSGSPSRFNFNGRHGYGGSEKIEGLSLFRRPLFVKGAVGGRATIAAYDAIKGKGAFQKMRSEVLNSIVYYGWGRESNVYSMTAKIMALFKKFGGGDEAAAKRIAEFGLIAKGNGLVYAIQENIVANTVRSSGYDSIIGWSRRRDGSVFMSEVFDLREITYPSRSRLEGEIHPSFSTVSL